MKLVSRYALVGIWNSIFGVANFLLLSRLLGQSPDALVLAFSYFVSIIQAHYSQRHFVWRTTNPYLPELLKFSSAYVMQFTFNAVFLVFSEGWFNLSREIRQIFIVILLTIVFYFVNKRGVFRVN